MINEFGVGQYRPVLSSRTSDVLAPVSPASSSNDTEEYYLSDNEDAPVHYSDISEY